jgi:hypothetical protein
MCEHFSLWIKPQHLDSESLASIESNHIAQSQWELFSVNSEAKFAVRRLEVTIDAGDVKMDLPMEKQFSNTVSLQRNSD